MSVLVETSAGDIVIDLLVDYAPTLCENFLKLCKVKYYNFNPVHSVQKDFSFQTGDPLGPLSKDSDGGSSIWGLLSPNHHPDPTKHKFPAEFHPKLKHVERGTVSMATVPDTRDPDVRLAASQFIVTLGDNNVDFLDGKAAVFGKVVEGFDVLEKINAAVVDSNGYPLVDIRIKHTVILDDPYDDPRGLVEPPSSPLPSSAQLETVRISDDTNLEDLEETADPVEAEKLRREREARRQALTLEMMGDLPFAEVAPPENILFVCKLNPVTTSPDLHLIFSRFGALASCEVITDPKSGDSLQYAFIEFVEKEACERAYFKMQDVLVDDRRIHVDFSQSVSKLSGVWREETNKKRARNKAGKGGFGGVGELEKWRKYREGGDEEEEGDEGRGGRGRGYRLLADEGEGGDRGEVLAQPPAGGRSGGDDGRGGDGFRGGGRGRGGYGGGDGGRNNRRRSRSRSPGDSDRRRGGDGDRRERGYDRPRDRGPRDSRDSRDRDRDQDKQRNNRRGDRQQPRDDSYRDSGRKHLERDGGGRRDDRAGRDRRDDDYRRDRGYDSRDRRDRYRDRK